MNIGYQRDTGDTVMHILDSMRIERNGLTSSFAWQILNSESSQSLQAGSETPPSMVATETKQLVGVTYEKIKRQFQLDKEKVLNAQWTEMQRQFQTEQHDMAHKNSIDDMSVNILDWKCDKTKIKLNVTLQWCAKVSRRRALQQLPKSQWSSHFQVEAQMGKLRMWHWNPDFLPPSALLHVSSGRKNKWKQARKQEKKLKTHKGILNCIMEQKSWGYGPPYIGSNSRQANPHESAHQISQDWARLMLQIHSLKLRHKRSETKWADKTLSSRSLDPLSSSSSSGDQSMMDDIEFSSHIWFETPIENSHACSIGTNEIQISYRLELLSIFPLLFCLRTCCSHSQSSPSDPLSQTCRPHLKCLSPCQDTFGRQHPSYDSDCARDQEYTRQNKSTGSWRPISKFSTGEFRIGEFWLKNFWWRVRDLDHRN